MTAPRVDGAGPRGPAFAVDAAGAEPCSACGDSGLPSCRIDTVHAGQTLVLCRTCLGRAVTRMEEDVDVVRAEDDGGD